ncbi:NADPH:quinone reductase [Reticulibacter mediterranei]|uniref:NADPH:quinone reductase n=1 Tax=Reticulibacter mediterranei TaxID=2778369 RepID=A0A8J3J1I5_9CHLR|nr:NADP-dependent oxidoreductase [Reticulibacter mediterranei]GHO99901.1 NADPH:quinone reductase [Reticulibacter mediterranei]
MSKQQRMQVVAITAFGGPERLTLMEMPKPVPGPGEVLIRIQASGVGLWDVKVRRGQMGESSFPLVLGWESAGTIEQVGTNVTGFAVGEAVYGYVRQVGHYAEYVAAPASLVARRPHSIDAAHAAAIPISGLTAHQAITEDLGLRAGETVLITAAAGGTGTLAVQMATRLGAYVIATASARNHHFLRMLGAQEVIDYTTTDFVQAVRAAHPAGVDVVLDCIGGETTRRSLDALHDGGRLAHLTEAADLPLERAITARPVYGRPDAHRLAVLTRMVDAGQLSVHLDRTLPLAAASEAHRLLEEGHVRGKMVLTIGEAPTPSKKGFFS